MNDIMLLIFLLKNLLGENKMASLFLTFTKLHATRTVFLSKETKKALNEYISNANMKKQAFSYNLKIEIIKTCSTFIWCG